MAISNKAMQAVLEGADESVRFQDDFFRAVNGKWISTHEIPADQSSDGSFHQLREAADENVHDIITHLDPDDSMLTDNERKVARFFRSWMNTEAVNAAGAEPIRPDIAAVQGASNKDELASVIGSLMPTGIAAFFGLDVDSDFNDPNRYTTFLYQSGIGLPDESYYREEKFADILEKYKTFVPALMRAALGLSDEDAHQMAQKVIALETTLASHHMNIVDQRNTEKINNPMSFDDFSAFAPGFPWQTAFEAAGLDVRTHTDLLVMTPNALKGAAQVWAQTDLEDLKAYTQWRILLSRAPYLSADIDTLNFDFYGKVLSGTPVQRDRWKRGVGLINATMGEAVGQLYVQRHFPPQNKEKMQQLVADLLQAYRESITNLDWMSAQTKQNALKKVDTFNPKIGYPDKWRDYSALEIGDDLIENIRHVSRFEFAYALGKLGKPVDRSEWQMNPQTVNAYYNPVWNEIVFPAAILQFPFFDPERDDALNYGGIGAVIGHEIGHGFDDQGSTFDEFGAVRNWWTQEDHDNFEARTSALVDQYDAFVPSQFGDESEHHVNGKLTLGENIGDLGGASIGLKAYAIALSRDGLTLDTAPVIDGYTGLQRFFLSYARIWQMKQRSESLKTQISTDPHSPDEFRTNGVVRNVDAFAQAFNVQPGDGMYLAPEDRVHIW
ncbi:MAG: M13-type metalloendopeptidase [Actinomycetaceae bacterium]|nr:peptidase M13 [Actinomycetaceae bacterium]MDY6083382.1 M13-type metalloendopeptidase [Actinomycetaceae bacterium]